MTSMTIKAVTDTKSGQVLAEVYVDDAIEPVIRSEPAFDSGEDLVDQILEMCRNHFPSHFPFDDDPTIGV